jgi:zinc transporter ZupT
MNADTIKALFTYLTAFILVIGGLLVLYLSSGVPNASNLQVIVAGFIGSALTFLFVQENSTRASRSAERQMGIGASAATPTTVNATGDTTVEGGNPTNVTTTASKP